MKSVSDEDTIVRRVLGYGTVLALGLGLGIVAGYFLKAAPSSEDGAGGLLSLASARNSPPTNPPWGELDTVEFPLELSDEYLPQVSPLLRDPKWWFAGFTPLQVSNLLQSCGLDATQAARLLDGAEWEVSTPSLPRDSRLAIPLNELITTGVWVTPRPAEVLSLAPASRGRLYSLLARSERNSGQRFPFRFEPDVLDHRIAASGLPADKAALVRQMAYTNDGTACLADLEALRTAFTTDELKSLLKALYQTPTLLLRVRISPQSDVDALVRYWGAGGRARFIKPFLEGLARVPGEKPISVSFFMPALARARLYTFPDPAAGPEVSRQDCLWTTLNFFNDRPDNRYLTDLPPSGGVFELNPPFQ